MTFAFLWENLGIAEITGGNTTGNVQQTSRPLPVFTFSIRAPDLRTPQPTFRTPAASPASQ